MIAGARDRFTTHSFRFVTCSCRFATCSCRFVTCSPRSIPYSRHARLPLGGRHWICEEMCWFATGQHDTMVVQASTIDTWKTRYNNTMHTERRSPCVLKWRVTCRRPVIVDVIRPIAVWCGLLGDPFALLNVATRLGSRSKPDLRWESLALIVIAN